MGIIADAFCKPVADESGFKNFIEPYNTENGQSPRSSLEYLLTVAIDSIYRTVNINILNQETPSDRVVLIWWGFSLCTRIPLNKIPYWEINHLGTFTATSKGIFAGVHFCAAQWHLLEHLVHVQTDVGNTATGSCKWKAAAMFADFACNSQVVLI